MSCGPGEHVRYGGRFTCARCDDWVGPESRPEMPPHAELFLYCLLFSFFILAGALLAPHAIAVTRAILEWAR